MDYKNSPMGIRSSVLPAMIGFLAAFVAMKIPIILSTRRQYPKKEYYSQPALLGDIGGTNLRLQLVEIQPGMDTVKTLIKSQRYNVKDHSSLSSAILEFLMGTDVRPDVAVIAIAGPIINNSVEMANALQWGLISGKDIGVELNITYFKLINDFEAISYGLLLLKQNDIIQLNGKKIVESKTRGVVGPGTGLGNSVLFNAPFKMRKRVYVLPSEGGQGDFWHIDQQTTQFFQFLKRESNWTYISVQKSFSGPTIPYMYRFYAKKYPQLNNSQLTPTGQQITTYLEHDNDPNSLHHKVKDLFLKLYGNAIGNFAVVHMPIGGIYLVGSITQAFLPYMQNTDLLADFKKRHPQLNNTLNEIPIVFPKEIDLGLKGSFFFAKRVITDKQGI